MVPLLEISAIQLLCWDQEIASSGAGHIVAMKLARNDTIFAPGGQLGGRVRELIQFESLGDHCHLLVVELGVPLV